MRAIPMIRSVYYGWIALGTVSITEVISWGILYYAFSVFVTPMETELGWSRATLMGAFSLSLLCSGIAAFPVGRWLDRHGPRALMTAGSILASLLLLAWSQVEQIGFFYLILAGIGVVSAAVLYEPAFAIVAVWFRQQRVRALTVLTFFGAWASFLFIPLTNTLIASFGWRTALLILMAILAIGTILPHALFLRRRPQDLGLLPDGVAADDSQKAPLAEHHLSTRAALRDPGFWWLSLGFSTSTFASVALTVHLIPYLLEQGHPPGFAAQIAGLFGLMSLAGRLLIGPLGHRFSQRLVTFGLMIMQLAALIVLTTTPTIVGSFIYVALFGAGSGTLTIMRAAMLANRYGASSYGSINGAQNTALTAARTLAPIGAAAGAGLIGGYHGLLWMLAGLVGVGALAVLLSGSVQSKDTVPEGQEKGAQGV
jgi:MFS family permease